MSKGDVQNQHGGVAVFKLLLAIPLKGAYHDRHTLVLAVLSSAKLQVFQYGHICADEHLLQAEKAKSKCPSA